MAVLSTQRRKALPSSKFGVPSTDGFPITDKVHAQKALQFIKDAPPTARGRIRRLAAAQGVGTGSKGARRARKAKSTSIRSLTGM